MAGAGAGAGAARSPIALGAKADGRIPSVATETQRSTWSLAPLKAAACSPSGRRCSDS